MMHEKTPVEADDEKLLFKDESFEIVGASIEVWKTLGFGFLESVYESSLLYELRQRGLQAERQVPIDVVYKGQNVGKFFADILVNQSIVLELKTGEEISQAHMSQAMHYLRATGLRLAIILNFSPSRMEFKRIIV